MAIESLKQRIGFRVMKRRESLGLSALELAKRAEVHRNTISRIESGLCLSIDTLWSVCKVLEITIDSLMEDSISTFSVQLELRFKRKYERKKLQSDPKRRSNDVRPMSIGLGLQRSGPARVPSANSLHIVRSGTAS